MITINHKPFEVVNPDDPYWTWVANGSYDHEWSVYDKYLKPEHTFIDLGAWIGSHSMYASLTAKKVIALEPDPAAHDILVRNLGLLNPRPEVSVLPYAVSNADEVELGSAALGASTTRKNQDAGNHIGAADPNLSFKAKGITLRTLFQTVNRPVFVKMDIEGMEEEVFQDWKLFHEFKPVVFVEFHPWWWKDEALTRRDFAKLSNNYQTILEIKSGLYLLLP
ncbi:MAG TPA: FkbM family methyltransferase [Candidatus Sulfotelmatobacter sp.]|nr:FkbM family methyltransferase [Candidatus Sulfotelmatobacter sp.]